MLLKAICAVIGQSQSLADEKLQSPPEEAPLSKAILQRTVILGLLESEASFSYFERYVCLMTFDGIVWTQLRGESLHDDVFRR